MILDIDRVLSLNSGIEFDEEVSSVLLLIDDIGIRVTDRNHQVTCILVSIHDEYQHIDIIRYLLNYLQHHFFFLGLQPQVVDALRS